MAKYEYDGLAPLHGPVCLFLHRTFNEPMSEFT